jgi:CubicO group peptidase (beta-lactamase class C family)
LLSHTSGIADYYEEEDEHEDDDFANVWTNRPSYRMPRPADFLPLFANLPPYRAPGQRFQYSNAGYILLGLIIEELTGAPYAEIVTQRVLQPAGMHASGFFALDEVRPDVAIGYLPPRQPGQPWRSNIFAVPSVGGADGGAFSNAADLDRFLTAYDGCSPSGSAEIIHYPGRRNRPEAAEGLSNERVWLAFRWWRCVVMIDEHRNPFLLLGG